MDKIHAMQLFVRVAELESFSRAAETLSLPKGSVSRQVQALENRLGTQLLHRTTRRVSLTQDGMVYYERAKDLLANLDELDGMFQHAPPAQNASTAGWRSVPVISHSGVMPSGSGHPRSPRQGYRVARKRLVSSAA
jgi:Transcriptional regulator